jgi:hypothetical protein
MRNPLITVLRKLNFVSRFLNSFPEIDFNVKGYFHDKEFIDGIEPREPHEAHEPHEPVIDALQDIEYQTACEPSMDVISLI